VARLRRQVTEPMAEALLAGGSARLDELVAFGRARPELAAYAHFRASLDRLGRDRVADVAPPLAGGGSLEPTFGYHLYGQWTACQQLQQAGAALPLYADLPVGVHPDGFDPWWSPGSFVPAVHGGAPPDLFFGGGQDWGFPPLHPEGIRQDGYRHLIAVLRRALRHAAYLRVDHVMGLQRLYMIPAGGDARHGAYVSYRAEELHALVSLEAHRAGTVVVGEDLGTVPAEVRRRMAADRMLRSWVFQFESTATEPLPAVPPAVLASMGTHDLPRFGAYLWGTDIDEREEAGVLSAAAAAGQRANRDLARRRLLRALDVPEVPDGPGVPGDGVPGAETTAAALRGCLSHLAQSAADLVLVDLEELWGERHPQNHPGTGPEAGNWRRRGARTLAEARGDPALTDVLDQVDRLRRRVAP
jgi:4-alpha-glucanotransferase